MMGLGSTGNWNTSSSNLSALAPPFSIHTHRSSSSSMYNNYNDNDNSQYDPFTSWQHHQYQPHPSAPRLSDFTVHSVSPSNTTTDVLYHPTTPLSTYYPSSTTPTPTPTTTNYAAGLPYHTLSKHNHVVPPSGSGLHFSDYMDYGCLPNSTSSFSSASHTHVTPGHVMEYGSNFKQDPIVSSEQLPPVSKRDYPHTTYTDMRHMEDNVYLEQILSFLPSDSNKTHTPANNSAYFESQSHGLSSDAHNNFSGYQNAFGTYINPLMPTNSPFIRRAPATRPSSSSVVIRPPPVIEGQSGSSPSTACNENLSAAVITNFDLGQKSNSEVKENPFDKDLLNLSKQSNVQSSASPSVKEFSTPLISSECSNKTSCVSQFPNVNVSDGFDTVQLVSAAEVSSDSADRHSIGVDSPCWRGVNSSQFSSLYVEDDFSNYYYKNSVDELYDIGPEMQENICSVIDSTRTSVCAGEVNKNQETECAQNGVMQKVQRNLDAVYPSRGPSSDNAKTEDRVSTRSIGVQINKDPNMPRKESGLPNNWMTDFDMNNSHSKIFIGKVDTGSTLFDVSDGNIAVHAAEKVLASPSSQEDTTEGARLQPDPKKDVTMIIEAMRNLSESLLLHLPNDFSTLEEKNTESLKLIINNLSSCMSKKIIKPTDAPNLKYPVGDDSKIGESRDKITISDEPHKTIETTDSHNDRDYWSMYNEVENNDVSCKKAEKSPVFSSSRDNSDIRGDGMAKAIKKVLDENLNLDEEMHPQALLFKSLWLEAEAKLCSISYRARFDRMKLQIEKSKPKTSLGNGDFAEVMAKNDISPKAHDDAGIKPMIGSSSLPRTSSHVGDVETSFMSRLSILKSRENVIKLTNKEKQNSDIVDADGGDFVMTRLKILKSRADNSQSSNVEEEKLPEIGSGGQDCLGTCVRNQPEDAAKSEVVPRPHFHGTGNHSEGNFGYGHKFLKELNFCMENDQMIHPLYEARMINQPYSGWHGSSSSSDWEHVLKDDFAWKNS